MELTTFNSDNPYDEYGFLSPNYLCNFNYYVTPDKAIKLTSVTQYYQLYKCMVFGAIDDLHLIISTNDTDVIKKNGMNIRYFDKTHWNLIKSNLMFDGNKMKFDQNPELKQKLMDLNGKYLVNLQDNMYWGIGLNNQITVEKIPIWNGINTLGKNLMDLQALYSFKNKPTYFF